MRGKDKLQSLKKLSENFLLNQNEDGFDFRFTISGDSLSRLSECLDSHSFIDSYKVDGVYVEFEDLAKKQGNEAKAELLLSQLRNSGLNVYWSWDKLLDYKPNLTSCPDNFLILSEGVIYPSEVSSAKLKHYEDICKFVKLLVSHADHVNGFSDEIIEDVIFLHKTRIEIPIQYNECSLTKGLDGISVVCSILEDSSHKEQKASILKEILYSLLINLSKSNRLNYLIQHFGEFSKRLSENYQLFVSEFSFDDVRKEYEEKKRDYFTKLNDVFSSVQVKMLGVPISLALSSLKMSSIVDDISFWTNFLLALSVVIYSVMMFMLISNQKHTLSALRNEYYSQMNRLKHQYAGQYEQIKDIIEELDKRHDFQKKCLNGFYVMTATLFLLVLALFFWNLPWKLILGCVQQIISLLGGELQIVSISPQSFVPMFVPLL